MLWHQFYTENMRERTKRCDSEATRQNTLGCAPHCRVGASNPARLLSMRCREKAFEAASQTPSVAHRPSPPDRSCEDNLLQLARSTKRFPRWIERPRQ